MAVKLEMVPVDLSGFFEPSDKPIIRRLHLGQCWTWAIYSSRNDRPDAWLATSVNLPDLINLAFQRVAYIKSA